MFQIKVYNFNKKPNSTARPASADGTVFNCSMKTISSILTPIVEVSGMSNFIPLYNYAYISEFKRYYFIEDIRYEIGVWLISMRCDVLASFRTDILNSTQYVLRSTTDYDTTIADSLYLTKLDTKANEFSLIAYTNAQYGNDYVQVQRSSGTTGVEKFFNVGFTQGCFIVGIVGNNTAGVTYYAFDNTAFNEFINTAMTFTPSGMTDFSAPAGNAIFNPIQYITTVRWFPVSPFYTDTVKTIKIGGYTLPTLTYGGYAMNVTDVDVFFFNVGIPKHPQSSTRSFLNLNPFTELNLFFMPFGCIPLDTTKLMNSTEVTLTVTVDYCGGSCILHVYRAGTTLWTPSGLVYTMSMDYGVQLPISSLVMDWKQGLAVSALSWLKDTFVASKPSEDPNAWSYLPEYARERLRAGQSDTVDTANKAIDLTASALGQISTVGSAGSFLSYIKNRPYIMGWFKTVAEEDIARFGRPLHAKRTLDNLSGYCVCSNAYVNYQLNDPTVDEQLVVAAMLNSGVYLE